MCPEKAVEQGSPDGADEPGPIRDGSAGVDARESRERETAFRRAEIRAQASLEGDALSSDPDSGAATVGVVHRAFVALAENVRDYGIFLMDPTGCITFWGEGARLLKGWTKVHAEGAHLRLLYPDGGSEDGGAEEHLRVAAETGEYKGEGHRIRYDGSTFWAGVTLTALRDADGTLLGFAKLTRDLSAQRTTEAARAAALEAAEEAARVKSHFIATMSHELRTPLNAVMGYADLLAMEQGGPLTPKHHEQIERIRASSQHLLGIVDDVLDLARIEAGRMVAARARLQLGAVISEAVVLTMPQSSARGVDLVSAMSGSASAQQYCGDAARVRQILVNLLSNAVKFTEPGGRITVSAETSADAPPEPKLEGAGPWVYVRVEDTGRGVPRELLDAIFEPFVQAETGFTRRHGGSGLGLDISRRLARMMGGDITVRSDLGIGSTFFLWLPAPREKVVALRGASEVEGGGVFTAVREAVLSELERILHAFVARLRSDPGTVSARNGSEADLEDHLASFLSDLAQTMSPRMLADAESATPHEGTSIHRTIAEGHGQQRARLGWREVELRREFEVLREELTAAVRRRVQLPDGSGIDEAIGLLAETVTHAEEIAVVSFRGAAAE